MKFEITSSGKVIGLLTAGVILSSACGGGTSDVNGAGGAAPSAGAPSAAGTPNGAGGTGSPTSGAGGGSNTAGSGTAGAIAAGGALAGASQGGNANVAGSPPAVGGSAGMNASGGSGAGGAPPSSSVAFASDRVTVTGVRGVTAPAQSTLKLHNGGASAAQVMSLAISGPNQALFKVTSPATFPASIAAGADLSVTIEMATSGATLPAQADAAARSTGSVFLNGTLTATLSAGTATANVYGLVSAMSNYEATLGQILTALGYKLNVGKAQNNWNSNTSMTPSMLPGVEAGTDEVAASHFMKAGTGNVGITLVARFSPKGPLPFGWYSTTTGCPTGCTTVGTMASTPDPQTSDKARMVSPPAGSGMATFDPGAGPFGIWIYTDQKTQMYDTGTATNGDYNYTQDALNAPANVHRIKTYPLKDAAGTPIAKSYLVCVEEAGNGDYQDYVFVLSNVTAVP